MSIKVTHKRTYRAIQAKRTKKASFNRKYNRFG